MNYNFGQMNNVHRNSGNKTAKSCKADINLFWSNS